MITERNRNTHARGTPTTARRGAEAHRFKHEVGKAAPIVAAVDDTPAGTAGAEAAFAANRDADRDAIGSQARSQSGAEQIPPISADHPRC